MKIYFLFSFCLLIIYTNAQIYNGDFETHTNCPSYLSQINLTNSWFSPSLGSSDYFNSCNNGSVGVPNNLLGIQNAHSGNAYAGILIKISTSATIDWREYIQTQLITPLVVGYHYKIQMYASLAEHCNYGTDALGALFSTTAITRNDTLMFSQTPQLENLTNNFIIDKSQWNLIEMEFTADSAYNFLTIGNFSNDVNTTLIPVFGGNNNNIYFYIDDISLDIQNFMQIQQTDTSLCLGESIELSAISNGAYSWVDSINPNIILSSDSILFVTPLISTTYLAFNNHDTSSVTININNPPIINLGNDTILCIGDTLPLDCYFPNTEYLWNDSSTSPIKNITLSGNYWLESTRNHCKVKDSIIVIFEYCLGLNNSLSDYGVIVYPNPFIDEFTIRRPISLNKKIKIKIIDSNSKIILENELTKNSQEIKIDISQYSKGTYYLNLIIDKDKFIKKIIKN